MPVLLVGIWAVDSASAGWESEAPHGVATEGLAQEFGA